VSADDFHLTASMSLLKLVIEKTDGRSVDQAATCVQRESLLTRPTVAVPLLHVDDSLIQQSTEAEAVDVIGLLQLGGGGTDEMTADDASDCGVAASGGCCFEDDIDSDYVDAGAQDYLPVYRTDVQKGHPLVACQLLLSLL